MKTREIISTLKAAGYSLQLVASQSGVNYLRLYRAMNGGAPLREHEIEAIERFAMAQPCMEGASNG